MPNKSEVSRWRNQHRDGASYREIARRETERGRPVSHMTIARALSTKRIGPRPLVDLSKLNSIKTFVADVSELAKHLPRDTSVPLLASIEPLRHVHPDMYASDVTEILRLAQSPFLSALGWP